MPRRCSVLNCSSTSGTASLHQFPNPRKHESRFNLWVSLSGNKTLLEKDPLEIYNSRCICRNHFDSRDLVSGQATRNAIPKLNLPEPIEVLITWKPRQEEITAVATAECWGVSYSDISIHTEETLRKRSSPSFSETAVLGTELPPLKRPTCSKKFSEDEPDIPDVLSSCQHQTSPVDRPAIKLPKNPREASLVGTSKKTKISKNESII